MMDKQQLITDFLNTKIANLKVGVIVKGVSDVNPEVLAENLSDAIADHFYIAAIGYDNVNKKENDKYTIEVNVEKAVLWRSNPKCAGKIIVLVNADTDKLHSLSELETVTTRNLTCYLIENQISGETNTPTENFWKALKSSSDYYPLDMVMDFVNNVSSKRNNVESISNNMWRLGLLCDKEILGTQSTASERLEKNRQLILAIGQLSEESRKKLSRSLSKIKKADKDKLEEAYNNLQNLYKYGRQEDLKLLDYDVVQKLFSASKGKSTVKTDDHDPKPDNSPIKTKELKKIVADIIVNGNEEGMDEVRGLVKDIKKHYNDDTDESISTHGGPFDDRIISLESNQTDLRKLVGKVCNASSWGGVLSTEETVLKDIISADVISIDPFNPNEPNNLISFTRGLDEGQSLFNFIIQFDKQFENRNKETVEKFKDIIDDIVKFRNELLKDIDLIMYYPVLYFGGDEEARKTLINYINAWARLYNMHYSQASGHKFS